MLQKLTEINNSPTSKNNSKLDTEFRFVSFSIFRTLDNSKIGKIKPEFKLNVK